MKIQLCQQQRSSGRIELSLIFGSIVILALIAARVLPVEKALPTCLFRSFTGISCPTCGTTRSLVHLAHGDVTGSLILNPLFSLLMMTALTLFIARSFSLACELPRIKLIHSYREGTFLRAGVAVLFLANWFYLIFHL